MGNQGGGLTLISRMVRRHPLAVSVTGDHTYWSGADEMQRVMVARLPAELRLAGQILGTDPPHRKFTPPRSWSYASDDLVDEYHLTEEDATESARNQFQSLIREALYCHGQEGTVNRFVDKSQVFTLKIRYIAALLEGTHPHFVLITRNPYAACYRAAIGKAGDMERYSSFMSLRERVEVCAQHWANSMRYALHDGQNVEHFIHFRFEDILQEPEPQMQEMCSFLGLDYKHDLLPAPHHEVPFGSRFRDRWYPLRPDVNEKYFDEVSDRFLDIIDERCGALAETFGYERP
nr:sulfotransferase [Salinibacter ruber]